VHDAPPLLLALLLLLLLLLQQTPLNSLMSTCIRTCSCLSAYIQRSNAQSDLRTVSTRLRQASGVMLVGAMMLYPRINGSKQCD
jgi:hypothetical protein